jgi:2-keto-4-pentenoate hydratase/2-oxohepta-3-ene-1,7-dioic acid hydratase in catechol pathway
MKLVSYHHDGKDGFGAVVDDGIADLSGLLYKETRFANLREALTADALADLRKTAAGAKADFGFDDVTMQLPINNPSKIFCVGRNYYAYHEVLEDGRPEWPSIFPRFRDSFSAHEEAIIRPAEDGEQLDYEGELVVIIGKQGRRISEASPMKAASGTGSAGARRTVRSRTTGGPARSVPGW